MIEIVARSRIGFWTAFMHEGVPHLNIRDPEQGRCITIILTSGEASTLSRDSEAAHALARTLAHMPSRRSTTALETPGIQNREPVVYEWIETQQVDTSRTRMAA